LTYKLYIIYYIINKINIIIKRLKKRTTVLV